MNKNKCAKRCIILLCSSVTPNLPVVVSFTFVRTADGVALVRGLDLDIVDVVAPEVISEKFT